MMAHRVRNRVLGVALLSLLGIAAGCKWGPNAMETAEYTKGVEEVRKIKDKTFRENADSPIPAAARAGFTGLAYYPVDISYRTVVTARPYAKQETIEMLTSQGSVKPYTRYAYVDVPVAGQKARLT